MKSWQHEIKKQITSSPLVFGIIDTGLREFLVGLPWSILRPTARLHDRLAGTYVVPR